MQLIQYSIGKKDEIELLFPVGVAKWQHVLERAITMRIFREHLCIRVCVCARARASYPYSL